MSNEAEHEAFEAWCDDQCFHAQTEGRAAFQAGAAYQRTQAQIAPAGYVMVPVEPTDAMKLAGNDALAQHWGAGDAYRAMLAASRLPVQPVQGMSNRSKRLDEIRSEAERFFEWPGDDHSTVTLTSCILFADHIAAKSASAAQGWIPVSEGLPNISQEVIVHSESDGVCAGVLDSYGEWFAPCSEYKLFRVTSWMPLPAAPEMKS